ncbi:MAG: sigma 54-interacting transcriptional regulator [Planctomycetota bacterium JB042]
MNLTAMRQVTLAIAGNGSVASVLDEIVRGIASCPNVALTRIWLLEREETADGEDRWLQLAASAGNLHDPEADPRRLDGRYARFEVGDRKVGRVAATGEGVLLGSFDPHVGAPPFTDPDWIAAEGIVAFAAQPLVARGETLGVLGVFDRAPIPDEDFEWLRTFADHAAVALTTARAFEEIERLKRRLELENDSLRAEVTEGFGPILGRSPALQKLKRQIETVAPTEASVLVLGESGVGKELVARAIHERSARAARPLIKVNCASIPDELFESEFFGHVRGAFTGASRDRAGRFEAADGGTLLLDEVGEIPLARQAKLLRVLQEGTFERVGEERTRTVDVRVLAATNRDLAAEAAAGRFRSDLYYRLSVFPIEVPPLRERREDVPSLAREFVRRAARSRKVPEPRLTDAQASALAGGDRPGNVRDRPHVVERAVSLSGGGPRRFDGLAERAAPRPPAAAADTDGDAPLPTLAELRRAERDVIAAALERAGGKVSGPGGAAELLDVPPTTLDSKLRALGLKPSRARR